MLYYRPHAWDYIRVRGLGFVPATGCPHVSSEGRLESFERMMRRHSGIGIAIYDGCAMVYRGDKYRVVSTRLRAGAYRIGARRGTLRTDPIPRSAAFWPVSDLFE
jgi:hypothetical protein